MLGVNFDVLVDEIDVMRVCDGYRLYDGQDYLCFVERRDDGKCFCWNYAWSCDLVYCFWYFFS